MLRLPKASAFYGTTFLLNLMVVGIFAGFLTNWGIKKTDGTTSPSVFAYAQVRESVAPRGVPVKIDIASLHLSLPVQPGTYLPDGSWTLDDTNAFFALPSVPVNTKKGTTLIYGHNTDSVFKRLNTILPGAELRVTSSSGQVFIYEYSFVSEVRPDDVGVFNATNAPNVTLQTCSGPWDELRSMYTFRFKRVLKS